MQQSIKALRQNRHRAERNLKIKEDIRTLIKKTRLAINNNQVKDKIEAMLKEAQKKLDKAAQKKIIKKNTAARKLARLVKYSQKGGKIIIKEEKSK